LVTSLALQCATVHSACAQKLRIGIESGPQLTAPLEATPQAVIHPPFSDFQRDVKRFTYGPTIEISLPWSLGVELEALHQKLKYTSTLSEPFGVRRVAETTATSWEVPILLKRYIHRFGPMRPYGDVGLSLRHVSGQTHVDACGPRFEPVFMVCGFVSSQTVPAEDLINTSSAGLVLGSGVDFQRSSLHISPEIRYTHWSNESFRNLGTLTPGVPGAATLRSNKDALEFLISFTFGL